NTPFSAPA
ncbi:hypothetical protein D047_1205B, partial [Vibrio parahaemolyticus VPTS-2010_2]